MLQGSLGLLLIDRQVVSGEDPKDIVRIVRI